MSSYFAFRRPEDGSPAVMEMLGRSEFTLRGLWPKRFYGAKAPSRGVGTGFGRCL